jgi:hypothetical protein
MKYFLRASDCPEDFPGLHPETIVMWRDTEPAEDDHRPWNIVDKLEDIEAVYQAAETIIQEEKRAESEALRLRQEQERVEEEPKEESP